jgi:predicted  nucleic acid-binding Zn-ribbon protein
MRELDRRIAILRLRLAEVSARQEQIKALQRQYKSQLDRLVDFAIYERSDLDSALSMAGEIDTRLADAERTLHHLESIKARGKRELDALLLTGSIEAAKADVAELETQLHQLDDEMGRLRQATPGAISPAEPRVDDRLDSLRAQHEKIETEIRRLRQTISEASDEAARTVAERTSRAEDHNTLDRR